MKKVSFLLCALSVWCNLSMAQSQKGLVLKECTSGNCKDGEGRAVYVPSGGTEETYEGGFKDSLWDGQGTSTSCHATVSLVHVGSFVKGNFIGYGYRFAGMRDEKTGLCVIDSNKGVMIGNWLDNGSIVSYTVKATGEMESFVSRPDGYTGEWDTEQPVKDKGVNRRAADYASMRKKGIKAGTIVVPEKPAFVGVHYEPPIIATKQANLLRDKWAETIAWNCRTGSAYFIIATPQTKYSQFPFGGALRVQAVAEDNRVVWEGEMDEYFRPTVAAKYTFLIKFYQRPLSGDVSYYADGLQLIWSLRSKTDASATVTTSENKPVASSEPGCLSGDCVDGSVTYQYPSGNKYVGDFKDRKREGTGTAYFANGDKFSGIWHDNEMSNGTYSFSNGAQYTGSYDAQGVELNGTMKVHSVEIPYINGVARVPPPATTSYSKSDQTSGPAKPAYKPCCPVCHCLGQTHETFSGGRIVEQNGYRRREFGQYTKCSNCSGTGRVDQ